MDKLYLILALVGFCIGFQAPLEYQYRYMSSIGSGIPELSDQSSGVALRGDVTVQVHNNGILRIQFANVEVAQFNNERGCDIEGDIPKQFAPMADVQMQNSIEQPFEVHLDNSDGISLIVQEDELSWVTNVRKGIVGITKNEFMIGNFKFVNGSINHKIASVIHNGHLPKSFSINEDSIFGMCLIDYTIDKLPVHLQNHENQKLNDSIEDDFQKQYGAEQLTSKSKSRRSGRKRSRKNRGRSRSSKSRSSSSAKKHPKLEEDLWHVTKTINFDNCEDAAFGMQFTNIGVDGELDGDQYKWLRARSSVAELTLRGSPGAFRIESATVEGATWMSPFGLDTESLQVRSTQTYKLVAVRKTKKDIEMSEKQKNLPNWSMQFEDFSPVPSINKIVPWITYLDKEGGAFMESIGAKHFTEADLKKIKDTVVYFIKSASSDLTDLDQESKSPVGQVGTFLYAASSFMNYLSKDQLRSIFDQFHGHTTHSNDVLNSLLVIDAMISAGNEITTKTVLEIIKEEKIPYHQIFTIAMTLTTSVHTPLVVPEIMDYVMSIDLKDKPFLGGTLIINFANLVHRLCIDPKAPTVNYFGKLSSDSTCNLESIENIFVPYLQEILEDTSGKSSIWEKEIALKAISKLGSPFAIPIVRDIIFGKIQCNKYLTIQGIYSLASMRIAKHTSSHAKQEIMSMMNEVFSNLGEDPTIRKAALVVMTSWGPKPSFWHRLARMSWREPSKQLSVYISSMIDSVANMRNEKYIKQAQAASSAKSFTKPYTPLQKHSQIRMNSRIAADEHVSKLSMFEWIKDAKTPKAINAYLMMMMNVGGFEMVDLEVILNFDLFAVNYLEKIKKLTESEKSTATIKSHRASEIATEFFEKIKDTVKFKSPEDRFNTEDDPNANIFIRAFEHIQLNLPFNAETYKKAPFIRQFFFKNQNSLAQLAFQLSLGYDLTIAKYFCPIYSTSFHSSDVGLPIFSNVNTPIVVSEDSITSLRTKARGFDIKSALESSSVKVESLFKLYTMSNSGMYIFAPWTQSLYNAEVKSSKELTLPLIITTRINVKEENNKKKAAIHFDLESYYYKKFPILRANMQPMTTIYPIIPDQKIQNYNIKNIEPSPIKEIHNELPQIFTGLQFDYTWKSNMPFPNPLLLSAKFPDFDKMPNLLYALGSPTTKPWYFELNFDPELSETKNASFGFSLGHYSEDESSDDNQYGQTYMNNNQEPDAEVDINGQVIYGDNDKDRFEKLKYKYGSSLWTGSLTANFVGDEDRSYEILMTRGAPQKSNNKKLLKAELSFFRGPIPGKDAKPLSICLDMKKSAPFFTPLDNINSLREANLDTQVEAKLYVDCKGQPEVSVKGQSIITEAAGELLIKEVQNSCDNDQYNEMKTLRKYATYNQVKYDVKWTDICDRERLPLLTKTYDILHSVFGLMGLGQSYCSSTHKPSKELHATFKRCPLSHHWTTHIETDGKEFDYEDSSLNHVFDDLFHIDHHNDKEYNSHECYIGTSHVQTFDGYNYDYKPSKCWTVAYMDCLNNLGAMLLVRSPEEESSLPEVLYISENQQFVIFIVHNEFRVNGKVINVIGSETVTDEDGDHIATITSKDGHFLITIKPHYYFVLTDVVQIHVPEDSMTTTCGLCGDYDGEPIGDLVGPQLCPYSEIDDFVASWSAASDTCAISPIRMNVERLQKKCHSGGYDTPSWIHKCSNTSYDTYGTKYNWKIFEDSDEACIAESPVPFCIDGCSAFDVELKQVVYQCWQRDVAPKPLLEALNQGQKHFQKKLQILEHHKKYRHEFLPTACKCF